MSLRRITNYKFRYVRGEYREYREHREYREYREYREHREHREYREYREHREYREYREYREHREHREYQAVQAVISHENYLCFESAESPTLGSFTQFVVYRSTLALCSSWSPAKHKPSGVARVSGARGQT